MNCGAKPNRPFQLLPFYSERVWGRDSLAPWFPVSSRYGRIGEVWFAFEQNATSLGSTLGELIARHPEILGTAADPNHPGLCPLLAKFLFTSDRLSVQVHPDDAYAQRHHQSLGKTEAWYVLDAQPPGELAVGLRESITADRFNAAAESGEIEHLLDWRKVRAGDTIFVPAGTVHAIGAGLTICEIQEKSDLTYRIYDYGRPRELHLEHALAVSHLGPHRFESTPLRLSKSREQLVACEYFRIEHLRPKRQIRILGGVPYYLLLLCIQGSGEIGRQQFRAGEAWMVPAQGSEFAIVGADSEWIATYTADEPAPAITAQ